MDLEKEEDLITWRPHILCLCELDQKTLEVSRRRLLHLAGQLRSGSKGLTVAAGTILGTLEQRSQDRRIAINKMRDALINSNVKGISTTIVANSHADGIYMAIMTAGLGGLRINTVLAEFPKKEFEGNWQQEQVLAFMSKSAKSLVPPNPNSNFFKFRHSSNSKILLKSCPNGEKQR